VLGALLVSARILLKVLVLKGSGPRDISVRRPLRDVGLPDVPSRGSPV